MTDEISADRLDHYARKLRAQAFQFISMNEAAVLLEKAATRIRHLEMLIDAAEGDAMDRDLG